MALCGNVKWLDVKGDRNTYRGTFADLVNAIAMLNFKDETLGRPYFFSFTAATARERVLAS